MIVYQKDKDIEASMASSLTGLQQFFDLQKLMGPLSREETSKVLFDDRYCIKHCYNRTCSWAIPDIQTLNKIADFTGPRIQEFGAGGGYWAYLLSQMGVHVTSSDIGNEYGYRPFVVWTDVYMRGYEDGPDGQDPVMLVWPPWRNAPGLVKLLNLISAGQKLVYVGESKYGCTGTDEFHDELQQRFDLVGEEEILSWEGIHDRLWLYVKK